MYVVDRAGEVFKILPTLRIMEVSGRNAEPLRAGADGSWAWEDLGETAGHALTSHKVYRSNGTPAGPFVCVWEGTGNVWTGGDPVVPAAGTANFYLATSFDATTGEETRAGNRSDGTPRNVAFGSTCP